jgi:hypothetical protein
MINYFLKKRFACSAAHTNPGTTTGFQYIAHPGRRVMGLKVRYTSTKGMDEVGINVLDEGSQGYVIDGCDFDDIPFLSPEEHHVALVAASKEHARKQASLVYHSNGNNSKSNMLKNGNADSSHETTTENTSFSDIYHEVDGQELSSRERAAIDRRVAEREAFIANEKYKEVLLEHAKIKQREMERAAERGEMKHMNSAMKKTIPSTMKSHSTKKKTSVTIINNTEKTVRVFWVDYRGQELEYYSLSRAESKKVPISLMCVLIFNF